MFKLGSRGVALVMVLLVLSALAIIAAPFAVSMMLHDRSGRRFEGEVKALFAARAAGNRAVAQLARTQRARESDTEAVELEAKRPRDPARSNSYQPAPRSSMGRRGQGGPPPGRRRAGVVRRADLGEAPSRRRDMGRGALDARKREVTSVDLETNPIYLVSEKGIPPKDFDPPGDLDIRMPEPVPVSMAPDGEDASDNGEGGEAIGFDINGLSTSVRVEDEQGKINLNSAPPELLANLLGLSRLAKPLEQGHNSLALEDGSPFRTDGLDTTLDGAVVVAHPNGRLEAMTYRLRRGNELHQLFRGAFLSVPYEESFPAGSFVYDLRGFKAGHHSLRAHAEGGFAPSRLGEFASLEALREISSWQVASLFIVRFRGEGLTAEFLEKNGIHPRKLAEIGLDPAIFSGDDPGRDPALKAQYQAAVKSLKKRQVSGTVIDELLRGRGARAVISLDARVISLKPAEVKKAVDSLRKALERDRRMAPNFDRKYLEDALENLAEVYRTPGIETLLPEEVERLRPYVTVSSQVPALWSESQTNPERFPSGPAWGQTFPAARAGELGGGALVRIRSRKDPDDMEFNRAYYRGTNLPEGGYQLAYPLLHDYAQGDAFIQALQRHPVNVNTAAEAVLRAIFCGVSGFKRSKEGDHGVNPQEAANLAALVRQRVPIKGPGEFQDILLDAAESEVIDSEDIEPLFLNSIQPNHPWLRTSTTGLCYATGDVYTVESTGVLRSDAGTEIASARLRQIVEVSAAEPLRLGLFSQADFASELFLRDPYTQLSPGDHARHSVGFPGIRGHLVTSTPLLLRNQMGGEEIKGVKAPTCFPIAGGEMGTLRLVTSEAVKNEYTRGDIYHFRNTHEGLELGPGEPFVLDITDDLDGTGQGPGTAGAIGQAMSRRAAAAGGGRAGGGAGGAGGVRGGTGPGGTGILDLTNMPAGVEFWVRFRTYPESVNRDGLAVLIDAGADEDRNRISLLYDRGRSEFVARIYDSSLPDPSIPQGKQYLEVRALRTLDLETWYHLRLFWDGTYSGGLQLYIDGLPSGKASFTTELAVNMPHQGTGAVPVKDVSALPLQQGATVLRVGEELIEVEGGTQIRRTRVSSYRPWRDAAEKRRQQRRAERALRDGRAPPEEPASSNAGEKGSMTPSQESLLMRGPWNDRGCGPAMHAAGTPVTLHGYSLEIVRKTRDLNGLEHQASLKTQGGDPRVWTPCGLNLADDLLPWNNFPPEVVAIHHYQRRPIETGGGPEGEGSGGTPPAGTGNKGGTFLAPVFLIDIRGANAANVLPAGAAGQIGQYRGQVDHVYSAEIQWAGKVYNAADFFQREGVTLAWLHERLEARGAGAVIHLAQADLYWDSKGKLPAGHPATQVNDGKTPYGWPLAPLVLPQVTGLRIPGTGWYPVSKDQPQLRSQRMGQQPRPDLLDTYFVGAVLRPISVLANGPVDDRYPTTGILEVRGLPPPWSNPTRPDLSSAPLFGNHPDDTVEWIRYVKTYLNRMFIGRYVERSPQYSLLNYDQDPFNGRSRFRGYPEALDDVKNQMHHRSGEPLRLVMELADGGAGYGDYVSIVTDDPMMAEPTLRRVYRVSERDDGRFFVSLVDVDQSGRELRAAVPYQNTYTHDMNPRLVKFPSGALPQIGTGRMVFFGEAAGAGSKAAAPPPSRQKQSIEDEETAGTVVDEIQRFRNTGVPVFPGRGQRIKHVLVPITNGRVEVQNLGSVEGGRLQAIAGLIPAGQAVSRENPIEILVVSIGRDPYPFAPGLDRGVLRIGEELFYFENPKLDEGSGAAGQVAAAVSAGTMTGQWTRTGAQDPARAANPNGQPPTGQPPPQGQAPTGNSAFDPESNGERRFDERMFVWPSTPQAQIQGAFEPEGFARLDDNSPELHRFYEIFYYRQLAGNRFVDCLRGQFQTAVTAIWGGTHRLRNVTTRLRLVGRSLLGTRATAHGVGDPVCTVPYLNLTEITGQLSDTGIQVKETKGFAQSGYLLLDPGVYGVPFEILAYSGFGGQGLFRRPLDEEGHGLLRACFGTVERPIHPGMFAYGLPFRYFDRYQSEAEGEDLAYLQKSFRVPGAYWRSVQWRLRRPRNGLERLCDVVVAARLNGEPDWSAKPTNKKGGIFFLEEQTGDDRAPQFPIDVGGDELELRIYFRYKNGSFQRVREDQFRDDWKETPVLEWIAVEYEKAGRILRHEEPPD